jgi:hypothetical protein
MSVFKSLPTKPGEFNPDMHNGLESSIKASLYDFQYDTLSFLGGGGP